MVQAAEKTQIGLLFLAGRSVIRRGSIGKGVLWVDVETDSGILRAQVGAAVGPRAAAAVAGRLAQHYIFRQILVQGSQTVTGPRAERRVCAFTDMSAGLECKLCSMVVVE